MADSVPLIMRQTEEYTAKWTEIIRNSQQIAEGPLKKYRLSTVNDKNLPDGKQIRRCTFGKYDPRKRNKTILLVGQTGAGKSTLINMMLNYMLGVKWEDDVRFEIIPDEGERPQTESQTTAVTAYEIYGLEEFSVPFSLTVIDTPGYGDTRGDEQDKCIPQNLYKLFHSVRGVQQLDAACIVVKATVNRLSEKEKYIFDGVLSLFGKNMEKNIMILTTHSNWGRPQALDAIVESGVPHAKDENDEPVHFLFDNPPFEKPAKRYERACKTGWENGAESMRDLFQTLDQMEAVNLRMTENVLKQRLRLEDSLPSLMEQAKNAESKQRIIEETKKILEEHREDMEQNNNFEYTCEENVRTLVNIQKEATRCTKCKENCHYPGCWWVSPKELQKCSVMKDGKCTVCPGRCSYTDHIKDYQIYVTETITKTKTYEELKKRVTGEIASAETVMAMIQRELDEAETKKTELMERSYQCIVDLNKSALKFNTKSTTEHTETLIDMFKKTNNTVKAQILKKML